MPRALRIPKSTGLTADFMLLPPHVIKTADEGRYVWWKGHAAKPNSGPYPETCGGCEHFEMHNDGHRVRKYPKCKLARHNWANGAASDIAKADPACVHWVKAPEPPAKPQKTRRKAAT